MSHERTSVDVIEDKIRAAIALIIDTDGVALVRAALAQLDQHLYQEQVEAEEGDV